MAKKKQTPRQWAIKVMRNTGIDVDTLHHRLGVWSNIPKDIVMKREGLTDQQYRERYQFLGDAFCALEDMQATGRKTFYRSKK